MKKKSFNLPFKSNFFKEQDPFHLVIVFFIIFFGTAIFFSIPTFYDYKKYNQKKDSKVRWNFQKYIVNEDGNLLDYFVSTTSLQSSKIIKLIEN